MEQANAKWGELDLPANLVETQHEEIQDEKEKESNSSNEQVAELSPQLSSLETPTLRLRALDLGFDSPWSRRSSISPTGTIKSCLRRNSCMSDATRRVSFSPEIHEHPISFLQNLKLNKEEAYRSSSSLKPKGKVRNSSGLRHVERNTSAESLYEMDMQYDNPPPPQARRSLLKHDDNGHEKGFKKFWRTFVRRKF